VGDKRVEVEGMGGVVQARTGDGAREAVTWGGGGYGGFGWRWKRELTGGAADPTYRRRERERGRQNRLEGKGGVERAVDPREERGGRPERERGARAAGGKEGLGRKRPKDKEGDLWFFIIIITS
jgi:hypothetical protein